MTLKDLLPPIIYYRFFKTKKAQFLPVFSSYNEAVNNCGDYNDDEIVEIVMEKTKYLVRNKNFPLDNKQSIQDLLVMQTIMRELKEINVIELGGACGAFYFRVRDFFPEMIKKWIIVKTPKFAEAGKNFFQIIVCHLLLLSKNLSGNFQIKIYL
jgi:putative methyltransferase (TIGR04325 family)